MRVATFLFVLLTIFSGALVIAEADAYRVSRSGSEVNFVAEPTEQNALDVLTWKDFSHSNRNRRHSRDRIVGEQVTHEIGADEWILFSDRLAQLDSSPITGRCVAGRFGSTHMSVACPLTGVRRVVVRLGDEDDIVSAAHEFAAIELPMDIYGGAGQDFIIGGKLSDRIFTGEEAGWRDLGDSEGLS